MANEETVTKVVEGVDRLFDEIVVNGRTVKSAPVRQSAGSTPVSTNRSEPPVQGDTVEAVQLNNVLHNIKDKALTDTVGDIDTAVNNLQSDVTNLQGSVSTINSKIPSTASAQNQLADKNFVNSSIATNTANFLGTYSTLAEIEAIPNPTNNDYAFLETADTSGNNVYDRYKYSADDEEWLFEYELNNSSFTAEQWATINSGITQVSDTVQDGDNNPVSSDAVYEALQNTVSMQAVFDVSHPVGETYTQYPEQSDPVSLYNQNGIQSTWTLLDYGGAFFRAEGGNALSFNNSKEVTAVSGAVLTIPSSGASVGCLIYDPVGNETKTVTAVSGNNVTVDSAFTSLNLTNVLIGQSSANLSHRHGTWTSNVYNTSGTRVNNTGGMSANSYGEIRNTNSNAYASGNVSSGSLSSASGATAINGGSFASGYKFNVAHTHDMQHKHSISADGETEARPANFTVKVWKRTA